MALPDPHASRAVLVGTSKYDHLENLPAVENNLDELSSLLVDKRYCGLSAEHCTVLSNPRSGSDVLDAIADAAEEATDMLIVYFSGHGLVHSVSGELYLGLVRSNVRRMHHSVRYEDIRTAFRGSRARRKLVILDCCYSGRAASGAMADDDSTGKVANSAELSGAYLMASTAATKISQSGETYTAFSGELIDLVRTGIPGCGDLLSVDDLFVGVREALLDKGLPLPQRRETDHGSKFHLFRNSALETWAKELYGAVPNIEPGTHFSTRMELHKARVHRPLQAGICGTAAKGGAESIVVSGGYRDDEDFGNTIIYTGHGGRDPDTGAQVKDQSPEDSGNAALIKSMTTGRPVRVIRGSGGDPRYSPPDGYSYDGLFRVTDFSVQRSVDGPKVILFRLENLSGAVDGNVVGSDTPDQLLGNYERLAPGIYAKRSHAEKLKKIYNYTCQVCETALEAPGNQRFAASVYIRALEYPHRGRDSLNNMLCLCPNDYNLFKFGALTIEDDLTVINQNDGEEVGNLIVKHDIDMANIRYHRTRHQRS